MSDLPGGDAAATAIHRAFAKRVRYTGAGVTGKSLLAVRSHGAAGLFMEDQQTVRQLSFEIMKADLEGVPGKGDTLVENDGAGASWTVIERGDSDEVDAWLVFVEAS